MVIFIHFLKFFGNTEPPHPLGNCNPFCGGVSIFSGTAQLSDGVVVEFDYNNRHFAC